MNVSKGKNAPALQGSDNADPKVGLFGKIFRKSPETKESYPVAEVKEEDLNEFQEYHNPILGINKEYFRFDE